MIGLKKTERSLLFFGDLVFLYLALWLTLALRTLSIPTQEYFGRHLIPFTFLFVLWVLIFFIAGLYDQHTTLFRSKLPERIVRVQLLNIIFAALFFFAVPFFGIAPKTNLVLYLVISSALIIFWRLSLLPLFLRREPAPALLIGGGKEFKELYEEINQNSRYPLHFTHSINTDRIQPGALSEKIFSELRNPTLSFVVIDMGHSKLAAILPHLYKPLFSNVQFIDARELYEDIFERLPLSVLSDAGALERLAVAPRPFYHAAKRAIDMFFSLLLGIPTLVLSPLLAVAIRLESRGPVMLRQERVGKNGQMFCAHKFRSMERVENGVWIEESDNKITRIGGFLRHTRLDELPQLWDIFIGRLSFIGPRPDLSGLHGRLSAEIPFYHLRSLVEPGLSGWAQVKQDYAPGNISPQSIEETKLRFMYDLYYLKHRSLMLDLEIFFRTIRVILTRFGS